MLGEVHGRAAPAADPARAPARPARPAHAPHAVAVGRRGARGASLFSPVVAWNLRHDLASFAFQTEGRVAHSSFRPVLVARFVGAAGGARDADPARARGRGASRGGAPPRGRRASACARSSPRRSSCVATVVSPFHWVKGNWLAPRLPDRVRRGRRARARRGAAGGGARASRARARRSSATSTCTSSRSARGAVPRARRGLRRLARARGARRGGARARSAPDAFVAGCNYKVSAELAYYLPGRPRTWSARDRGGSRAAVPLLVRPRGARRATRDRWCSTRARRAPVTGAPRRAGRSSRSTPLEVRRGAATVDDVPALALPVRRPAARARGRAALRGARARCGAPRGTPREAHTPHRSPSRGGHAPLMPR